MDRLLSTGKIFLQQNIIHREIIIKILLQSILPNLIILLIWRSLFSDVTDSKVDGYNLVEITHYYIVVTLISILSHTEIYSDINKFIYDGSLSYWLLKPVSFFNIIANIGAARTVVLLLPMLATLISLHFFTQELFIFENFFTNTLLIALGLIILFLINCIIGTLSFWFIQIDGIKMGLSLVMGFLGGMVLPLSMLPTSINIISLLLPYRYVFYEPIQNIISNGGVSVFPLILMQSVWIVFLFTLYNLLWEIGLKKFDAVGG